MNIWEFNAVLSWRLLSWNIINIVVGMLLSLAKPFWRGIGSQSIGWGFVNIAIAIVGGKAANRRYENLPNPLDSKVVARESKNLRRILWVNTALDVLYIIGGVRLSRTRGKNDALWEGIGIGIVIQGALLFVFDLIHARVVPQEY